MTNFKSMDKTPVLYVIVRNDLASMNAGKAEAHSGHAACAFMHKHVIPVVIQERLKSKGEDESSPLKSDILKWYKSTPQGFGTQINLDANIDQMHTVLNLAKVNDVPCELVVDPTYPFLAGEDFDANFDGSEFMLRKETTALYIFGQRGNRTLHNIVGGLRLKP